MNPVSWTQKRGFYMTKLSRNDKIEIQIVYKAPLARYFQFTSTIQDKLKAADLEQLYKEEISDGKQR